jgi:hypothetical protein
LKILLRVGVTMLSLILAVGAAALAVQVVGPYGDAQSGFAQGTATQLLTFLGTLVLVGGTSLIIGLTYLERSFQRAKRKARRRSR